MKNTSKFLLFLIYTILIFYIQNYKLLIVVAFINIMIMIIFKINFKKMLLSIIKMSEFILITVLINILLVDLKQAILIGIKLILVCNITYEFSKILSYNEVSNAIEQLLLPLKIIGIKTKDLSLTISIAIAFIPIMKAELTQIKNVLKIKGFEFKLSNLIKNSNLIFKPFFISVLRRVNELESSIISKAYQE